MTHVPYKGGAGPAVTALVSGETQLMFTTLSSVVQFVNANRLRALAVTSPARVAVLPAVPTTTEVGVTELVGGSWQGLFFPRDTPTPVVDRVFAATLKAMADDDVKQRLAAGGVEIVVSASPAEYARYVVRETQKWEKAVKESGATAE
jgi:tripartite-type tricarboxylate transporter receptor subunit TctC